MRNYIVVHSVRVCTEFVPETYGRLTAIGPAFLLAKGKLKRLAYQACQCDCGCLGVYSVSDMQRASCTSCGCLSRERAATINKTHGRTGTAEYKAWKNMNSRCYNPKNCRYSRYGGRGIAVCDRWKKFSNFLVDMGMKPSQTHSLDRINLNGDYEPGNCRWATRLEQMNNTKRNHLVIIGDKTDTLANWCRFYGVPYKVANYRLRIGIPAEQVFNTNSRR